MLFFIPYSTFPFLCRCTVAGKAEQCMHCDSRNRICIAVDCTTSVWLFLSGSCIVCSFRVSFARISPFAHESVSPVDMFRARAQVYNELTRRANGRYVQRHPNGFTGLGIISLELSIPLGTHTSRKRRRGGWLLNVTVPVRSAPGRDMQNFKLVASNSASLTVFIDFFSKDVLTSAVGQE